MGYMALYRKFRPGEFEDVKGQDAIVTTLKIRYGRTVSDMRTFSAERGERGNHSGQDFCQSGEL